MPLLQAYRNRLDFVTPADQLESIFTNIDILQKSGSKVELDSYEISQNAQKSLDDILVRQTKADEIRKLCQEIEKLKLFQSNTLKKMDQKQTFDSKNLELLAQFDENIEPPEFLSKILGSHRAYLDMSVQDRIKLNQVRKYQIELNDLKLKQDTMQKFFKNDFMYQDL